MSELPELNVFMMCEKLNLAATRELPHGFHVRTCRKDELDLWKAMPFDDPHLAKEYHPFMTDFFNSVYGGKEELFFEQCLFVCDHHDIPVGTCFAWKVYDTITTIHWFKVKQEYEGLGIGRALLSIVMSNIPEQDYPVFLHTQPESYRAIKLYSDFGFALLSDPVIGPRQNHLEEVLPQLKEDMPPEDYDKLRIATAPDFFLKAVASSTTNQF